MSSAYILCKQFRPLSGPKIFLALSGLKLFDTLMVFLIDFFKNTNFGKKSADNEKSWQNYPIYKKLNEHETVLFIMMNNKDPDQS